jgi:hypothetical protein
MQVLHHAQKFERPLLCIGWRFGIRSYGAELTFNGTTFQLKFMKLYKFLKNISGGHADRQADRQQVI